MTSQYCYRKTIINFIFSKASPKFYHRLYDLSMINLITRSTKQNKIELTKRHAFSVIMSLCSVSNYLLHITALSGLHSAPSHLVYNENIDHFRENRKRSSCFTEYKNQKLMFHFFLQRLN